MKPLKKTKNLPLLPVLERGMIPIPVLIVTGCIGQGPQSSLEGTGWTLTAYIKQRHTGQVLDGTKITLESGNDGRITGSGGCNHYFASCEVKGMSITEGPRNLRRCTALHRA